MEDTVHKMQEYLGRRSGKNGEGELEPVLTSYLTSVLLPSNSDMSLRNSRELTTLARSVDMILAGDIGGAADVLVQRFKAVETAHGDGGWGVARHMELIPDPKVTAVSQKEREQAAKLEKSDLKLRELQQNNGAGKVRPR